MNQKEQSGPKKVCSFVRGDEAHQRQNGVRRKYLLRMDYRDLKSVCGQRSRYGRANIYKEIIPCESTLRRYRAENREDALFTGHNKVNPKIPGENFKRVPTYKSALKEIEKKHPTMYSIVERSWNMDKTAINGEHGREC